jgi:hypothetical protein
MAQPVDGFSFHTVSIASSVIDLHTIAMLMFVWLTWTYQTCVIETTE